MIRIPRSPATCILCVLFLLLPPTAVPGEAQEPPISDAAPELGRAVRLFLDCKAFGCFDDDFFRTEIQFVNWVRDREDSGFW